MNGRILMGMTLALAVAVLQASAFGQAAAESVLLNGATSTATVKAGSRLGAALNQSTSRLAGRVQQQTQPAPGQVVPGRIKTVPKSSGKGTDAATPGQGPVIASVQGAATHCAPTSSTPGSAVASARTNCSGQSSGSKSASQNYKPVINLSLQK